MKHLNMFKEFQHNVENHRNNNIYDEFIEGII